MEGRTPSQAPLRVERTERGRERMAVRAGRVRIAIGSVGVVAAFSMADIAPYRIAFVAYLVLALVFQRIIAKELFPGIPRALAMGTVDMLFLSFVVQLLGSVSTPLPIVYVAAPVLYATTTSRRRLSIGVASVGMVAFALIVILELIEVLPYAPASPGLPAPDPVYAIMALLLVGLCAFATSALTSQLIRRLEDANARLQDLSQHDELTGLYNRRYVMARLGDELARLSRRPSSLTVAMVDLDGFKRVNDEVGHDAGDDVLRAVAVALLAATRKADVVARIGGDEFVVLLPNTDHDGARAVSMRVLDHARDAARRVCPSIPVSASIGTTLAHAGDDPAELLRRVDEQLYTAKRAGGDRVQSG
jgi:diguanylate cyclase (GGDEF)-like protein